MNTVYTLVQHSGYGYAGDPTFARAVEERSVSTQRERETVAKAGGVILATYKEAYELAEKENYPPEVLGMVPRVAGRFSSKEIDGLRVYCPKAVAR